MNIGKVGREGERKVANFLKKSGCQIIKRNFQSKYGEIDIIAEDQNNIIFVEVKTRKENSLISGKEAVDAYKQKRITLTANDYISKTECEKQPRFDIAEVTVFEKENGDIGYKLCYVKCAW